MSQGHVELSAPMRSQYMLVVAAVTISKYTMLPHTPVPVHILLPVPEVPFSTFSLKWTTAPSSKSSSMSPFELQGKLIVPSSLYVPLLRVPRKPH